MCVSVYSHMSRGIYLCMCVSLSILHASEARVRARGKNTITLLFQYMWVSTLVYMCVYSDVRNRILGPITLFMSVRCARGYICMVFGHKQVYLCMECVCSHKR